MRALNEQERSLLWWIERFEDHKRYMAELREKERAERALRRQFKKTAGTLSTNPKPKSLESAGLPLFKAIL
jgi:hypothetical protein